MEDFERTHRRYRVRRLLARWWVGTRYYALFLVAVLTAYLWAQPAALPLKHAYLRASFQLRGPTPPSEEILIVSIQRSLASAHGGVLPRSIIADALERLASAGVRALFIDAHFSPDDRESEANTRIASAIGSVPTVIGAGRIKTRTSWPQSLEVGNEPVIYQAARWVMEFDILTAVSGVDHVASYLDNSWGVAPDRFPKLPMQRALSEATGLTISLPPGVKLLNFYGPPGSIRRIPVEELLQLSPEALPSLVKDRIIFLGAQDLQQASLIRTDDEQFSTTFSRAPMYGVEIQATIASNLLNHDWLRYYPALDLGILVVVVFGIGILQMLSSKMFFTEAPRSAIGRALSRPRVAYSIIGWLLLLMVATSFYLFVVHRIWVATALPVALYLGASLTILSFIHYLLHRRFTTLLSRRLGFKSLKGRSM